MKLLKHVKYAKSDDDLVFFIHDGDSTPNNEDGWNDADLYLHKLTIDRIKNRKAAENVCVYEHERVASFVLCPGPEVAYEEHKCLGKGAYLFLKNWAGFRRFLRNGK